MSERNECALNPEKADTGSHGKSVEREKRRFYSSERDFILCERVIIGLGGVMGLSVLFHAWTFGGLQLRSVALHIVWAEMMVAFMMGIVIRIFGEILRYLRLIHESADEIKKALQAQESQDES